MKNYKERARERFEEFKRDHNFNEFYEFNIEQKFLLEEEFKTIDIKETKRRREVINMIKELEPQKSELDAIELNDSHIKIKEVESGKYVFSILAYGTNYSFIMENIEQVASFIEKNYMSDFGRVYVFKNDTGKILLNKIRNLNTNAYFLKEIEEDYTI